MCEVEDGFRLDQIRRVFISIQLSFFVIGCFFVIATTETGVTFSADTWGSLAHAAPARWWAYYGMIASAVTLRGLLRPMRYRWITVGAALHCVQFLALALSAALSGGDKVVSLYAFLMFFPLHVGLLREAVRYGRGR